MDESPRRSSGSTDIGSALHLFLFAFLFVPLQRSCAQKVNFGQRDDLFRANLRSRNRVLCLFSRDSKFSRSRTVLSDVSCSYRPDERDAIGDTRLRGIPARWMVRVRGQHGTLEYLAGSISPLKLPVHLTYPKDSSNFFSHFDPGKARPGSLGYVRLFGPI